MSLKSGSLGSAAQALARAHRTRLGEALAPHGLHAGQEVLLEIIWNESGLRPADIATRLGVEPPTVTRMLKRLERGGLVERVRDRDDARSWRIHPTPRSRLLEATVRKSWVELDEFLVEALGSADAERLWRLQVAASEALRKHSDAG